MEAPLYDGVAGRESLAEPSRRWLLRLVLSARRLRVKRDAKSHMTGGALR